MHFLPDLFQPQQFVFFMYSGPTSAVNPSLTVLIQNEVMTKLFFLKKHDTCNNNWAV